MNKILTVSIAAYNVEEFIENTLNSLLIDNIEDLEILVQDDGGNDRTKEIVEEYEKKYPDIIKLVHKENGGYGSTINSSIELAKGKYFKQLDGDDLFKKDNFKKFLDILRNTDVDVVYTSYIKYNEKKKESEETDFFDKELNGTYNLDEVLLKNSKYLNMYTLTYKTDILKKNNIRLSEHTFYTDTEYAIYPIIYCKTIAICHFPIYFYNVGREGQSVGLESRLKHYEDQIKVSKRLVGFLNEVEKDITPNQTKYLQIYISYMVACSIGDFLILLKCNKENLQKIKDFEQYIYDNNKEIYYKIEKTSKLVKLLRKSNYKLYKFLHLYKRREYR